MKLKTRIDDDEDAETNVENDSDTGLRLSKTQQLEKKQ